MKLLVLVSLLSFGTFNDGSTDFDELEQLFPKAPEAVKTLTMPEMLEMAGQQSFAIQKAIAKEQRVKASQEKSLSSILPNASAGLAYNGELQLLPADERSHRLSGTAQIWLPLIDVSSWIDYKVSKNTYQSQKTNTELIVQQVSYQLAIAYLQAVSMRSLLELLRNEAVAIVSQRQIAAWRIRAGVGSASEELQAQVELISLRKEYTAARLSYIEQCETLGQLLGYDGPVAPADQEPVILDEIGESAPERLELTLARQNMDMAADSLKSSKFNWIPTLGSTWQIGAVWPLKPEGDNRLSLGAAINLSIPLFNWATIATIRQGKADLLAAKIEYQEQEQQLKREERLAQENLIQLQTEVALYQEQAQLSAESLTLDLADYQNGRGSVLQVINSRRNHQVAQVQELRQKFSLDIAKLNYWQTKGYKLEQIIK